VIQKNLTRKETGEIVSLKAQIDMRNLKEGFRKRGEREMLSDISTASRGSWSGEKDEVGRTAGTGECGGSRKRGRRRSEGEHRLVHL